MEAPRRDVYFQSSRGWNVSETSWYQHGFNSRMVPKDYRRMDSCEPANGQRLDLKVLHGCCWRICRGSIEVRFQSQPLLNSRRELIMKRKSNARKKSYQEKENKSLTHGWNLPERLFIMISNMFVLFLFQFSIIFSLRNQHLLDSSSSSSTAVSGLSSGSSIEDVGNACNQESGSGSYSMMINRCWADWLSRSLDMMSNGREELECKMKVRSNSQVNA